MIIVKNEIQKALDRINEKIIDTLLDFKIENRYFLTLEGYFDKEGKDKINEIYDFIETNIKDNLKKLLEMNKELLIMGNSINESYDFDELKDKQERKEQLNKREEFILMTKFALKERQ